MGSLRSVKSYLVPVPESFSEAALSSAVWVLFLAQMSGPLFSSKPRAGSGVHSASNIK
jgi:hypothetical protein